jgi:glycosyltransferase involved in cell wall biosynthesis
MDGVDNKREQHLAVCVCTRRRPAMLRKCLQSVLRQKTPDDIRVSVFVIDNEPMIENREIGQHAAAGSGFPVNYVVEPKPGIPFARNAALAAASSVEADWIAFIDDDEIAGPNWISSLMAVEYRSVPILMGRVEYVPPDTQCFWVVPRHTRVPKYDEGAVLKTASTNNVRFAMAIVDDGIRFNEKIGLGVGEDTQFFAEAMRRGYQIRYTDRAVTREMLHPARLTYMSQCYRAYVESASVNRVRFRVISSSNISWVKLFVSPLPIIFGLLELSISPFVALIHKEKFKEISLRAGRRIARVLGMYAGMLNLIPKAYRQTVGS